jgi:hypothetical protein
MNPVGCKQGMVAGAVFQTISVQPFLGHSRQYPCNPFCNLEEGPNRIIAKVMGIISKLQA